MPIEKLKPEILMLVQMLDDGYDKKGWHGPNLRGPLRRLTADQASWRPAGSRRSIAEIIVHCAYWKYAVRRRLRGEKRGSFPLKGSNWFPLPKPFSEDTWHEYVALLDLEHRALRQAVAEFPRERLARTYASGKYTYARLIYGIACHDVYHAGQIRMLKRLQSKD